MLETFLDFKPAIKELCKVTGNQELGDAAFSDLEWRFLQVIKDVFTVFIEISTILQSQTYSTLNLLPLYINQVYHKLQVHQNYLRELEEEFPNVSYTNTFILKSLNKSNLYLVRVL
jgi:hypothetical protein